MSSLLHAIHILRCFSEAEPELRLSEISRRLELSKGNTHRLLTMLVDEGLVRRGTDPAKYRLGLALFELGQVALSELDLRPALPKMMELGRQTSETVLLGVLDDWDIVYVQRVESPRALRVAHGPRDRAPVHATATGKALLAWRSEAEIERFIRHGLPDLSPHTITDADDFRNALAEVRRRGYAINDQERELMIRSISAPVRDNRGTVIAALTVAGPSQRLPRAQIPRLATLICQTASDLSRQLAASAARERRSRAAAAGS
jgi:IclR family transcriptional regulator, KDG regulon repressor